MKPGCLYKLVKDEGLSFLGLIKSNPKRIIADGTDWRLLDELKRELKA